MKKDINCPNDNKKMKIKKMPKTQHFRGIDIEYEAEEYVCPECGLEVADRTQAGEIQRAISDAYRSKVKLLNPQPKARKEESPMYSDPPDT